MITMNLPVLLLIKYFIIVSFNQIVIINPTLRTQCLAFQSGVCITCPYNFHTQGNQCFKNVNGCLNHTRDNLGITKCLKCDQTVSYSDNNGGCILTVSQEGMTAFIIELIHSRYYSSLVNQYGDLRFQSIRVSQALSDPYFAVANNYMLNGQYRSYISKGTQPVRSVSTFRTNGDVQFRILYNGSGGGLMLCIITIKTANNAIILNSFVLIALTNVIEYCEQYSLNIQCLQCASGYHLQNSICYPNIYNCISYYQNICLQCAGYSYLLQNRCVTSCQQMGDSGQLSFFGDFRLRPSNVILLAIRSYLWL